MNSHSPASGIPPCLYCSSQDYEILYRNVRDRLHFVPGEWEFWRCRQCGSATLSPHPKKEDLTSFYPALYGFTPQITKGNALKKLLSLLQYRLFFRPQYASQARAVLRHIELGRDPKQLLDVGCGRGLRLEAFRNRGFHVEGADFQKEVVEYLKVEMGITAVRAAADELGQHYPPNSFDVITAYYVLEHVPDVRKVLQDCYQLLRPGGWFVGAIPLCESVHLRLFGSRSPCVSEAARHLSIPSRDGITMLCKDVGYEQISVRPDSALMCAGVMVHSVIPETATTHLYGSNRFSQVWTTLMGAMMMSVAIPWSFIENYLFRRPSIAVVFAHKPDQR